MKIICFGAGAIGSYIGGSLAQCGNEVVFIDQPAYIPILKADGISIKDINGITVHLPQVECSASAASVLAEKTFDIGLIAVKSNDTAALIQSLLPLKDQLPPLIDLQNGVENESAFSAAFAAEKVIPASVCTAISRGEKGIIQVEKLRGIGIYSGHSLSQTLCKAFQSAGLNPKLMPDAQALKWSKMISNLLSNAASAILDLSPQAVYKNPISFKLERRQILETLQVMRALGIDPVNIPGVPVQVLCLALQYLPEVVSQMILTKAVGGGRGAKMPSFYIDLYAGKKESEVEYLNGAVFRAAQKLSIAVPVNQAYYQILTNLANGSLPLDTYKGNAQKLAQAVATIEAGHA